MEAIIAYGCQSSENIDKFMFDGISKFLVKRIKNSSIEIKEKKNILLLFNNIINNGVELTEEKKIKAVAEKLKKKGLIMIKKRNNTKEERVEWRKLIEAAHLLLLDLKIKNGKGEEEEETKHGKMKIEKVGKEGSLPIELISSLSHTSCLFSNHSKIMNEDNLIINYNSTKCETCIIGKEMRKVYILFIVS